jgi:cbb3-type cytochrome oxidase subunit 3
LPAFALIVGLLLIDWFIFKTNKKIAADRAKRLAEEAKKAKAN